MLSNKNDQPVVILTGHRKSGTSLLHRLFDGVNSLNSYPVDISVLYAYFPYFTSDSALSDKQLESRLHLVVSRSLEYLLTYNPSAVDIGKYTNILTNEIVGANLRSRYDILEAIRESWSKYNGISSNSLPFLFKETSQSIFLERFLSMYPNLKMISVVRDPRDNFAAIFDGVNRYYSKMGEGELESLSSLINRGRMDMLSAAMNQEKYPESFLAIKFEDLVSSPERVLKSISKFLGIEFDPAMLVPSVFGVGYTGNSHDSNSIIGVSSSKVGAWRSRVSESSIKIIEYWLAKEMDVWGYQLEFSETQSHKEFSRFYEQYNSRYFYSDSFVMEQG